jgi:hypothetical protein
LRTPVWSNFEIADLDFWRGPAYTAFFDFLESRGGFYYEVCLILLSSRVSFLMVFGLTAVG